MNKDSTQKIILITGATDGIGLATAKMLAAEGHQLLLHGRNAEKLADVEKVLSESKPAAGIETFVADLAHFDQVQALAAAITASHSTLDVVINNAGIFHTPNPITHDGLDIRFVVNSFAPYLLTRQLMPLLSSNGRVVNLSSAAQSPVSLQALAGEVQLPEAFAAYAQSKLALTMWSRHLAEELGKSGPAIIAVNPGSMLASKMVKEGFGVAGNDLSIGAGILTRAALSDEFNNASGKYFDNDAGKFSAPHQDALDQQKCQEVVAAIEAVLNRFL